MQNKPNFRKSQMNVSNIITRNYKHFIPLAGYKNKPNSNPIKPNLKRAKMNINSIITKDYRKKDDFTVRINKPNSKPISEKPKMNVNLYILKDYENKTALRLQKNKPNSNPISVKKCQKYPRTIQMRKKAPACRTILSSRGLTDWYNQSRLVNFRKHNSINSQISTPVRNLHVMRPGRKCELDRRFAAFIFALDFL